MNEMHTKRYILTAIALLLVTILCAGLAYADESYSFTYGGKTYAKGVPIDKIYYYHSTTASKAETLGEIMEITANVPQGTDESGLKWGIQSGESVELKNDKCSTTKLVVEVKKPGSTVIWWGKSEAEALATLTINLNVVDATLIYTRNPEENYKFAPGSTYDFKKDYKVENADPDHPNNACSYSFADVVWEVTNEDGTATTDAKFTADGILMVSLDANVDDVFKITATLDKKGQYTDEKVSPVGYKIKNGQITSSKEYFVEVAGVALTKDPDQPTTDATKKVITTKTFIYVDDMNRTFTVEGSCDHLSAAGKKDWTGFKWESSDPTVATVTQSAAKAGDIETTVTIKGPGSVTITATAINNGSALAGMTNSFSFELIEKKAKAITFDSANYPDKEIVVEVGDIVTMTSLGGVNYYALVPEDGKVCSYTTDNLTWTVDSAIAEIDYESGALKALAEGTVNVTATLKQKDSSVSLVVPVTIVEKIVKNPAILMQFKTEEFTTYEAGTVEVGGKNLVVTAKNPKAECDSIIMWKSSDDAIATVKDGIVTGVKAGSATITAYAKDNENVSASVKVTVVDKTPVTAAEFTAEKIKLWKEENKELSKSGKDSSMLKLTPAEGACTYKYVTFSSANPEIAYVYGDVDYGFGVIGVKEGTTTITASVRNLDDSIITAEVPVIVEEFNITGLAFGENEYKMTLYSGRENNLNLYDRLVVKPDDWINVITVLGLEDDLIVWSSNKSRIATVDQNGIVTAHAPGEVTIYAVSAKNKDIAAQATVTITGREASKIKLNKDEIVLEEGQALSEVFTMTVQPANAYIENISYKFSKTGIATVEDMFEDDDKSDETKFVKYAGKPVNFLVAAKGQAGETWLTITANDGEKDLTAKVKIVVKTAKKNLAFKYKEHTVPIFAKKSLNKVTLKVLDKDTGKEYMGALAWSSSDKDVATVNKNGTVTLKAEGTTEITATTKDGNKTAVKTKLTVKKWAISKLTGTNKQLMTVGQKVNIKDWVTVKPVGKVYNDKLTLKSSAKDVVMVDSLGNISALKAGEATITVTAKDDTTKTKTIKVTVVEKKEKK
jgi:uncharacterized protein YjdB